MKNWRDQRLQRIWELVTKGQRIGSDEGLYLYEHAPLGYLSNLADRVNKRLNNGKVWFNRNMHIEPTNICIYHCRFCSYSRKFNEPGAWEMNLDQILEQIDQSHDTHLTEVHIVGGVHPQRGLEFYEEMIREIKLRHPNLLIKAFTAVELDFMFRKSRVGVKEGLIRLKKAGLDAIPGGGAEIFDETLRAYLCPDKADSDTWLAIHREAHKLDIPTNATMLYGHLESYKHRVDHLNRLRDLQDETSGFQAFIPLKYRKENNLLSDIGETSTVEDLRNYAISRIYLDNFIHLKAYWPMIGREVAALSLSFGVDDLDGTIQDTTRIYSMAGAEDQNPTMTTDELITLIRQSGCQAVERDTLYRTVKIY